MTITAYATDNIKSETLATGLAALRALQNGGIENFADHPAISGATPAEKADDGAFRFTPDLDRITAPLALVLYKSGTETKITLPADGTAKTVLHKTLTGKTGGAGGTTPKGSAPK